MAEIKVFLDGEELEEKKEVLGLIKDLSKTKKDRLLGFLEGLNCSTL